ncbi:riboflavin synthase [Candidatus Poribacteria bacterium]|nr:riboflavin synthase [Candidatus Poribacteria bacterium]
MFTGIIQEIGTIQRISPGQSCKIMIRAKRILKDVAIGDSVSVDGACLTVATFDKAGFQVDAMPETIERTTLKYLKVGSRVNMEASLKLGDKMGGHWVTGHVDGTGKILNTEKAGNSIIYEISISRELSEYLVPKGSVAVDGISLTIIECGEAAFSIGLIPHTLQNTTLVEKGIGDHVNLETDVIGKYVRRHLKGSSDGSVTEKLLRESGFI